MPASVVWVWLPARTFLPGGADRCSTLCRLLQYLAHLNPVTNSKLYLSGVAHTKQESTSALSLTPEFICSLELECRTSRVSVLTAAYCVDNKQKDVIETAEIGVASLAKSWTFLDRYASCCIDRAHYCTADPDCNLVIHTLGVYTLGLYRLVMHMLVM